MKSIRKKKCKNSHSHRNTGKIRLFNGWSTSKTVTSLTWYTWNMVGTPASASGGPVESVAYEQPLASVAQK